MRKSFKVVLILLVALTAFPVAALYYSKGDTEFSVRVGGIVPAIIYKPYAEDNKIIKFNDPVENNGKSPLGSKIGGFATLSYQGFTSEKVCLGGEIGFDFLYTNGEDFFTIIPLTFKATYVTKQTGKFDLNLHCNIGASLLKYRGSSFIPAPYAKITVNPVWFISKAWGLGAEVGVQAVGEFWMTEETKDRTTVFGALPITFTAIYRH